MRLLRLVTILSLLLTLPFFGLASLANARACHEDQPVSAEPAHDCCPGEEGSTQDEVPTQGDGCSSCIAAHACKTPQPFHSSSFPIIDFIPLHQVESGTAFARIPALSPDLPLRPPRS